jgi:hypothetical protein
LPSDAGGASPIGGRHARKRHRGATAILWVPLQVSWKNDLGDSPMFMPFSRSDKPREIERGVSLTSTHRCTTVCDRAPWGASRACITADSGAKRCCRRSWSSWSAQALESTMRLWAYFRPPSMRGHSLGSLCASKSCLSSLGCTVHVPCAFLSVTCHVVGSDGQGDPGGCAEVLRACGSTLPVPFH